MRLNDLSGLQQIMEVRGEAQTYSMPAQMSTTVSAAIAETSQGEVILCHDNAYLYAARVIRSGGHVMFQKFSLPGVSSLAIIIKHYFIALFDNRRIIVFEVGFDEAGKITLKFILNKQRVFASLFLREVAQKMAELQIFYPENDVLVYQFTVNGKVGTMNYGISNQNKLRSCERQQLYGSKSLFNGARRMLYTFTSFSNSFLQTFSLAKFEADVYNVYHAQPIAYVSKFEEFFVLLSNLTVVNIRAVSQGHRVICDKAFSDILAALSDPRQAERYRQKAQNPLKVSTYFDMVLIQDPKKAISYVIQLRLKNSELIGVEYGQINWFWTASRKLVGLSHNRTSFKILEDIKVNEKDIAVQQNPKALSPKKDSKSAEEQVKGEIPETKGEYQDLQSPVFISKSNSPQNSDQVSEKQPQLQLQIAPEKFKPMKIIQKNKVSVSKAAQKPKETQPMSQQGFEKHHQIQKRQQSPLKIMAISPVIVQQALQSPKKITEEHPVSIQKMPEQQKIEQRKVSPKKEIESPSKNGKKIQKAEKVSVELMDEDSISSSQQQISVKEIQTKKQGDVYPKQSSQASEQIVVDQEIKQNIIEPQQQKKQDIQIVQPQPLQNKKVEEQENKGDMPKSLALLLGKSSIGQCVFSTSINRNKIFSSLREQEKPSLKKAFSDDCYYSPLTSTLPLAPYQVAESIPTEKQTQKVPQILEKTKELFESTTNQLLKVIEELASLRENEPYLKEKTVKQLQTRSKEVIQKMILGDFTSSLERYIDQVLRQTDAVHDESARFYKELNSHRAHNLEVELLNQEKVLAEVRQIDANLRFCISHMKEKNQENMEQLFRDWTIQSHETRSYVERMLGVQQRLQQQEEARLKRYEQTKKSLEAIKTLLVDRVNAENEKKQAKTLKLERRKQEVVKKDKRKKLPEKKSGRQTIA